MHGILIISEPQIFLSFLLTFTMALINISNVVNTEIPNMDKTCCHHVDDDYFVLHHLAKEMKTEFLEIPWKWKMLNKHI